MSAIEPTQDDYAPKRMPAAAKIGLIAFAVLLTAALGARVKSKLATNASQAAELKAATDASGKVEKKAAAISTGAVERWRPVVRLEGTLQPAMDVDLAFRAPGQLASIKARLGQEVKAGQILATLDQESVLAQLGAAQAGQRAAEAQLALAEDAERRTSKMNAAGAVAESQAFQAANQLKLARAQVEAASAQVALAQSMVGNHQLKAPFGGVVTSAPTALGMIVGAGTPLFHLTDVSKLRLLGTIAPEDASLAEVGATISVGLDGRTALGKVTAVLPTLEPATRRVRVEAEVENSLDPPLRAGAFVRASIEGKQEIEVLRFPASVIRPGSDDEVLIVEANKLVVRRVLSSSNPDGTILVRSGLAATDRVLTHPTTNDREGTEVVP
jgi:RND family efflux transporter MFP subunit